MGVYSNDEIDADFMKATKGLVLPAANLLAIDAKIILDIVPDNDARDMAISHLLHAANMIYSAYVIYTKIHADETFS